MGDITIIVLGILVVGGVFALGATWIDPVMKRVELISALISAAFVIFVMLFVCLEVISRYLFNSPIPGHLELSELLMPVIVFFAIAYTQSTGGHVRMTLVVDMLPERLHRLLDVLTLSASVFIYAVLTYFSGKQAYRSWEYDDVTMTPPYFLVWPSAVIVPIGIFMCMLRLYLELLQVAFPSQYPLPGVPEEDHLAGE